MKKDIKSISFALFHIIFWVVAILFFWNYSYSRPFCRGEEYKEILSVLSMAVMVYLNYFILIPKLFFNRKYWSYILLSLIVVAAFSFIEFFLVKSCAQCVMENLPNYFIRSYLTGVLLYTTFRYFAIFAFFTLLKLYEHALDNIETQRELATVKDERNRLEKEYLETRVSPVYLSNVISSLRTKAMNNDTRMAEYIEKLAVIIDYYMNDSKNEKVMLADEIDFYQKYLELELLKREDFIAVSLIFQDLPSNVTLQPLLFEPIIYNACKHLGLASSSHMKFQFSFREPNVMVFESKSTMKATGDPNSFIYNESFEKLARRLQFLFPNNHILERNISDEYIEVTLSLNLSDQHFSDSTKSNPQPLT
ncbi:histidine kinase [Bacteroidales bacterium OttesenSCG-928-C03]|nr:histidine kinase [Bacteroidales bacterium OttesenSCG-928-C03]MDL2325947.1 histidine kinase [Bacteroidales bacterium OttesenSCG-928-A14]